MIIFVPSINAGLHQVPATGGMPEPITFLDRTRSERSHRWPTPLPGGRIILFVVDDEFTPDYYDDATIEALDRETGERKVILENGTHPRYVPGGPLVFVRGRTLWAVDFDLDRLETLGEPVAVLPGLASDTSTGGSQYSVAQDGSLVYAELGRVVSRLIWVDRETGEIDPLPFAEEEFIDFSLAPDGRQLAASISDLTTNIWIYDLEKKTRRQVTENNTSYHPVWSRLADEVLFSSSIGVSDFQIHSIGLEVRDRPVSLGFNAAYLDAWGDMVLGATTTGNLIPGMVPDPEQTTGSGHLIWIDRTGEQPVRALRTRPFIFLSARFSPDGKWLAFSELGVQGAPALFVADFPEFRNVIEVSRDGGESPRWTPDGSEILFRNQDKILAVSVETEPGLKLGTPKVILNGFFNPNNNTGGSWDLSPDGKKILLLQADPSTFTVDHLNVVLNWSQQVRQMLDR